MSYKDILVYVDATEWCAARLDFAADLARGHAAHLTALFVDMPPYTPPDVMGTSVGASVKGWQNGIRRRRLEEAQAIVDAARQRTGIDIEWRVVEDSLDNAVLLHGRYCDLIVLTQEGDPLDLSEPLVPSLTQLCLASGRPLLVVPRENRAKSVGRHVLIAWKATAEATRALHDALPLLQKADKVTVAEVTPDGGADGRRIAGADIARHLVRHGVTVQVTPLSGRDEDAGRLILEHATRTGADMIVTGAYTHSRLWQMVMGGTTKHILETHKVPVLLSH